ncbi:MAG: 30S ribosomal protein S10 [Halobacteriaceae archaeon]
MSVRTRITLESGDRAALDDAASRVRDTVRRKGADLRGPFDDPARTLSVPLYPRVDGDATTPAMDTWEYTVYRRRLEVDGHEDIAHHILDQALPESVRIELEVDQTGPHRP